MKRMQAIVSGKKKQCTKLPTPAPQKGSSKKSTSASDTGQSQIATKSGLPPSGKESSAKGKEVTSGRKDSNPKDAGSPSKVPVTSSGSLASSGSSTVTASNSSLSTISAASSARGSSKIPASSPKKGSKDATPSKERVRLDSEGKSKSKSRSDSSSKKSSKEKQKSDQKSKASAAAVDSGDAAKHGKKPEQTEDPGYVRRNLFTDESRQNAETLKSVDPRAQVAPSSQNHRNEQPQQQPTGQTQPANGNGRVPHDPRVQVPNSKGGDSKGVSSEPVQRQDSYSTAYPRQSQQPLHGILKDTNSNGGSTHNNGNYFFGANEHPYNPAYGQHSMENPNGRNGRPPSRNGSARSSTEQMYLHGYGSLPRSSRSTTPTAENIYSYGSLPRRSNSSTPTPQSMMFYNNGSQSWSSLSRKAESECGYPVSGRDRGQNSHNYAMVNYTNKNGHGIYGQIVGNDNRPYATVNYAYQPPRPGSVPPPSTDSADSIYCIPRPGSVPPHYYSDTESGITYYRPPRAGSVPLGYESESSVYGVPPRSYESDSGYATRSSLTNLRVQPGDEQYRAGPGKRPIPRRHTVGAPHNRVGSKSQETERKREAFMQLLAQRYPQYADKIQGIDASPPPQAQQLDKPARSRDAHRRRTAVVNYDPHQHGNTLEYDDLGTMSDLELPSFQRGGFMRTSLPIVRSASTSLERPLGLVFLVYGDQTKKSLLPNEITTLDTVRALFVRAFPDLTLEMLESPRKKIYLLDPATNIYFQLEDLAEIKDRSVLKIHETDSDEPQKVKERQEVRGRTVQMPARIQPRHGYGDVPAEVFTKAQSLPPQASHTYPEMMQDQRNQWEIERRSRSRTPEPAERPRSLSAGAASRQRFSHSPDRLPTPERGPLNPIPENRQLTPGYRDQGNYYEAVGPGTHRGGPYPNAIYDAPYQGYPPPAPIPSQQTYVARSTRAPPMAHPQRAVAPGPDRDVARGNNTNRHSLAFAPMSMAQGPPPEGFQRSQSYRIPPTERDGTDLMRSHSVTPADDNSRNRIEKMEQQLANLTAWVHYQKSDGTRREGLPPHRSSGSTTSDSSDTFPASSASKHKEENSPLSTLATSSTNHVAQTPGLSDIPDGYQAYTPHGGSSGISSRESTPLSAQAEVHAKVAQLKSDLHVIRRQQQLNMETMREEFMMAFNKIKKVLSAVPAAEHQVNFHKRAEATSVRSSYINDRKQVDQELSDLEASVEELRTDVISRQCRVNVNDVEGMALLLSNITKSLADLKARFPEIQTQTKDVIEAEMKTAVAEEQFLKEEPAELENSLKRCKKLTGTLYTLKRLASVQDHRPPQVPNIAAGSASEDQKNNLLENIRALVPDHEQRVQQMEAADASRERKKKISTQQEALKFGKSLEMASKNLRPSSTNGDNIPESNGEDETAVKATDGIVTSQPSQVKPAVPAKPVISSSSSSMPHSTPSSTVSSTTPSNVASVKPSFSAALTTAKSSDKPTATVSAMTANVSDSINTTATKMAATEPNMRNGTMPSIHTGSHMSATVDGGTGAVTHAVKAGTEPSKKVNADLSTYQVCGPVNPVFKFPVFNKENSSTTNSDNKTRPTDFKEKLTNVEKSKPSSLKKDDTKPTESSSSARSEQPKKASVSFSETPTTISPDRKNSSSVPSSANSDRYSPEKGDLAIQKQAARNAFFSSLNTPPASPSMGSPTRNSVSLDPSPVVSPGPGSGLVGKVTPGPTINLMLSGTASPKSPKSPGSFNIEVKSPPPSTDFTSSLHSPSRGIPRLHQDSKALSLDSSTPSTSQTDASGKPKKVPPPPPPRKGSRPVSGTGPSISPVNGGPPDSSTQGTQEPPQFVGGILGQHRLSGGPLSSTPKPASQQKPMSRFEKDIASGIYANMNRPDLQSQKSSPQQMMNEAKPSSSDGKSKETDASSSGKVDASIPPPPSVTLRALDREERGSSSESTSSSSGTSMGSQQSVISLARSSSVSVKPTASSKSKPEPPRRQSSLLAKFTGSHRDSKKMNNGNAKLNGVDL